MKLSPLLFAAVLFFAVAAPASANTDPPTWLDVQNYGADPTGVNDSGPAINAAIAAVTSPGQVIFFPKGTYRIKTRIVDTNLAAGTAGPGIFYMGFGRVELFADNALTGSIMKFGTDTPSNITVTRRWISNIWFECNSVAGLDGIDLNGLVNSKFENIEIRDCANYGMRTVGNNWNNWSNTFEGGGLSTYSSASNGIYLNNAANGWTFKDVHIANMASSQPGGTQGGIGLELEGAGVTCLGCDLEGWYTGLTAGWNLYGGESGLEVAGGYFENNSAYDIRIGASGYSGLKFQGVSIHGVYFHGTLTNSNGPSGNTYACVFMDQADGFTVTANVFNDCATYSVLASANGSNAGGNNGFVGPNTLTAGSVPYSLFGSNITLVNGGQITQINSTSNCNSTASPAVCGGDAAGSVTIPVSSDSVVVNTTAVTANSQILVTFDSSLGSRLGVTCNTTAALPSIIARTPGVSFTIHIPSDPVTNPACFSYSIIN